MCGVIGTFFRSIIVLGCGLALILQTINTVSCRFVYKESESEASSGGILSFGLYSVGYNGVCVEETHGYDAIDADSDRLLTSARVCNIVSMTSGVIAMVLVATECIRCKIGCGSLLENLAFLVAWTTGLSVYVIFGMEGCGNSFGDSEFGAAVGVNRTQPGIAPDELIPEVLFQHIPFGTTCNWGPGATYNIIASLIYLVCGVLLCIAPQSDPIFGENQSEDEEDPLKKRATSSHDKNSWYNNSLRTNLSGSTRNIYNHDGAEDKASHGQDWYKDATKHRPRTRTNLSGSTRGDLYQPRIFETSRVVELIREHEEGTIT